MMNVYKKTLYNNLMFFLMGMFVFSSLSSTIIIDMIGFPISLPELFFFPFILILKEKIGGIKVGLLTVLRVLFGVGALVLLALLLGYFPLRPILSSSRNWVYLFLFISIFSKSKNIGNKDIMWLSFGSLVAFLVDSLLNFQKLAQGLLMDNDDTVSTYGVLLSVPLFISSAISLKYKALAVIGIILLIPTMIFAGTRRLIVVVIVTLFVTIIMSLFNNRRKFFSYIIISFFIILISSLFINKAKEIVNDASPAMYFRVFGRVENFIKEGDTGTGSDKARLNNFTTFYNNIEDYILPKGMVAMGDSLRNIEKPPFIDFPLIQLCWMFGVPIALLILLFLFRLLLINIRKYRQCQDPTSFVMIISFVIIFVLFFLEGTFISFPYATPITGFVVGRGILNSKNKAILF